MTIYPREASVRVNRIGLPMNVDRRLNENLSAGTTYTVTHRYNWVWRRIITMQRDERDRILLPNSTVTDSLPKVFHNPQVLNRDLRC